MKKLTLLLSIFVLSVAVAFDASARYKGDLNGDDRVDLADMVYLAKAIKAGSNDTSLDINASGKIDDNDLQKLADIIISGKLTEDSGLNVGIGGWDDSGEDYGGVLKAPAGNSRSVDEIRLDIGEPRYEFDDISSMDFRIVYGDDPNLKAVFFNLWVPVTRLYSPESVVLTESISRTHKVYGTPRILLEEGDDYVNIRFIIFSSELNTMSITDGILGRIYYSAFPTQNNDLGIFVGCQIVAGDEMRCLVLPRHESSYRGSFDAGVNGLSEEDIPCEIYTTDGQLLRIAMRLSEIQDLPRGLYIIRLRGKTIKLLK